MRLLDFPKEGVNKARIDSLRKALESEPELLPSIIEMLLDYTWGIPPEAYHSLPKCEDRLVEALAWAKRFTDEID